MQTLLLILQFFVVLSLIAVILLQPSEGGALGFGGNKDFMSVRGTKNALTRLTTILAASFFVITILLIVVSNVSIAGSGVLNKIPSTKASGTQQNPGMSIKPITITIPPAANKKEDKAANTIVIPDSAINHVNTNK